MENKTYKGIRCPNCNRNSSVRHCFIGGHTVASPESGQSYSIKTWRFQCCFKPAWPGVSDPEAFVGGLTICYDGLEGSIQTCPAKP